MLAALCVAALVAGLVVGARGGEDEPGPGAATRAPSAAPAAARQLRRELGQLLVSSFEGGRLPDYLRRRLRAGETTGAILFGRNVGSADAVARLTGSIQRAAGGGALVAADQEGGAIRILPFAGPPADQAEQGDAADVRRATVAAARELRAAGVNVNLAPVADVATTPRSVMAGRAFRGGPEEVAASTAAATGAMLAERVAATAKHFPGFGRAVENTDDAPVTIAASRDELEAVDLEPFRAAIDAGVPLVMASHALYTGLDERRIASQSPTVLQSLLREQLGFRGAVVTDSLEAEAVLARSSVQVAAERSLAAGADLLLMTGRGSWNLVFPYLLRRSRRSPALRERIAQSAARVRALKQRLGLAAG